MGYEVEGEEEEEVKEEMGKKAEIQEQEWNKKNKNTEKYRIK